MNSQHHDSFRSLYGQALVLVLIVGTQLKPRQAALLRFRGDTFDIGCLVTPGPATYSVAASDRALCAHTYCAQISHLKVASQVSIITNLIDPDQTPTHDTMQMHGKWRWLMDMSNRELIGKETRDLFALGARLIMEDWVKYKVMCDLAGIATLDEALYRSFEKIDWV